jgi:argonaute-like protein implicated in RNA metabolism and viral defense
MSDTPRTDAAELTEPHEVRELGFCVVRADFARELERELQEAQAKLQWFMENQNQIAMELIRDSVSPQKLADALVNPGVIHAQAIEDKEGYDDYRTWDRLKVASDILPNVVITDGSQRSGETFGG